MPNNDDRTEKGAEDKKVPGFYSFDLNSDDTGNTNGTPPPANRSRMNTGAGGAEKRPAGQPPARRTPPPEPRRQTTAPQSPEKPPERRTPQPGGGTARPAQTPGGSIQKPAQTPGAGVPKPSQTPGGGTAKPPESAPRRPEPQRTPPPKKRNSGAGSQDDFEIEFDFENEYRDMPSRNPFQRRQDRRTGCFGGLLLAAFVLCMGVIIACLGWLAATDVLGLGSSDSVRQVTIPRNYTIEQVTDILYENDLIKYKFLFKLYADLSRAGEKIAAGTYELNTKNDYYALIHGMSVRGGTRVEKSVMLPEGFTLLQMFTKLEAEGICTADDLWSAAADYDFDYDFLEEAPGLGDRYRLEGYLFPDTYTFYLSDTPTRVLSKMLDNFKNRFKQDYRDIAQEKGYTIREIVIIASLIEKEAGVDEDRSLISSVIYNRLKSADYPRLEIDATILYAIAETEEAFSIAVDSPYNTYRVNGLPPGPIANPGLKSIQAALEPAETNWYFYALGQNGKHSFFKTYDEHIAFVNSDAYGG